MPTICKLLETKMDPVEPATGSTARQVTVICSSGNPDRIGDIIVQQGIDLSNYRQNPVVLWGHKGDMPVARCSDIGVAGDGNLRATVDFPPEGEDADADWVYGKIKNKLVNAVSIGFIPAEWEPVDAKNPWDGYKFVTSELLEFSFCSVPMNADALIVGRSLLAPTLRNIEYLPPSRRAAEEVQQAAEAKAEELQQEAEPDYPAALTKVMETIDSIHKAGRVVSSANEERLRAAHNSIGEVLNQLEEAEDPKQQQASEEVRPRQADEGRSPRFPRRAAAEIELMKMRAA